MSVLDFTLHEFTIYQYKPCADVSVLRNYMFQTELRGDM